MVKTYKDFKFGDKIRFKKPKHPDLKQEFCLVGRCNCAVAIVPYDKKGDYNIEFVTIKDWNNDIEKIEEEEQCN